MSEALAGLAAAGGNALVGAAGSDLWVVMERRLARLLGGRDPAATAMARQRLERTRREIQDATTDQVAQVRFELAAAWTSRLEDLLDEQPQAADDLKGLIDELALASGPER